MGIARNLFIKIMKFSDFVIKKQCLNKAVETIACIARGLCFLPLNSSTEILLKTLLKAQNPRFGRGFVHWRRRESNPRPKRLTDTVYHYVLRLIV